MPITGTTTSFFSLEARRYVYKNALQRNEEVAYIEPTLTSPVNFDFFVPVKLTTETTKYLNGKPIVVKALADTPLTDIVGFTVGAYIDKDLYFTAGATISIFKGKEVWNQFTAIIKNGETIKAGDELEFVPADNTYAKKTTGTAIVKARQDGAGGDTIIVEPLI